MRVCHQYDVCENYVGSVSNECDEPTPVLRNISLRTVVKLYTSGVLTLGVSLVSGIVIISACVS